MFDKVCSVEIIFGFLSQTTKRKGWINQGIDGPESIADHMYRMALMALIADDLPGLDRERLETLIMLLELCTCQIQSDIYSKLFIFHHLLWYNPF